MKKISAIICVFNEESTIKDVILSVSKSKLILLLMMAQKIKQVKYYMI